MAGQAGISETARMVTWRDAVMKEQAAARMHEEAYGFMFGRNQPKDDTRELRPYGTVPIKYYRGGATVTMKRLPMLPQDKAAAAAACTPNVDELISTQAWASATGREQALESTVLSHAKRMDIIRSSDPFFRTTTQTYGSRLPIEQFGVKQHGHRDTPITRWDRREYD